MLLDAPFNDIGSKRTIRFNALGVDWCVEFENNGTMAAIGEAFVSFLQIMLCEIAFVDGALLVSGKRVEISITQGFFQREYVADGRWEISIPEFDSNDHEKIQLHHFYLGTIVKSVLSKLTTRSAKELDELYIRLVEKEKLGEKVIEGTAYQRAYKRSVDFSKLEDAVQGADFTAAAGSNEFVTYKKLLVKGKNKKQHDGFITLLFCDQFILSIAGKRRNQDGRVFYGITEVPW
jgi:hypothetical protein